MITIDLPMPPSTNRLWRSVRGRNIKSQEYRDWMDDAGWTLNQQRPGHIQGQVEIAIRVTESRGDLDNRIKPVLDLLVTHKTIEGDSPKYLRRLQAEFDSKISGCRVTVRPYARSAHEVLNG